MNDGGYIELLLDTMAILCERSREYDLNCMRRIISPLIGLADAIRRLYIAFNLPNSLVAPFFTIKPSAQPPLISVLKTQPIVAHASHLWLVYKAALRVLLDIGENYPQIVALDSRDIETLLEWLCDCTDPSKNPQLHPAHWDIIYGSEGGPLANVVHSLLLC